MGGARVLNEELERDFGVSLELRTGVNTGEAVTGTAERLATGDAVNVAARLEQAAPPGEILLGDVTGGIDSTHRYAAISPAATRVIVRPGCGANLVQQEHEAAAS